MSHWQGYWLRMIQVCHVFLLRGFQDVHDTHTDIDTHHMSSILHQMVLTIQFPEWDGAVRQQLIYKSIYIFYLKFEIILTGFPLENLVLPGAGRHR